MLKEKLGKTIFELFSQGLFNHKYQQKDSREGNKSELSVNICFDWTCNSVRKKYFTSAASKFADQRAINLCRATNALIHFCCVGAGAPGVCSIFLFHGPGKEQDLHNHTLSQPLTKQRAQTANQYQYSKSPYWTAILVLDFVTL